MSMDEMNILFVVISMALGLMPILIVGLYILETGRGVYLTDFSVYKKFVKGPSTFCVFMLALIWFTTTNMDGIMIMCFKVLLWAWGVAMFVAIIASALIGHSNEGRIELRKAALPCLSRVIMILFVFWLIC